MRSWARMAIGCSALLFSASAMADGGIVGYELGGRFVRFDPVVEEYSQSGELFRIDGLCRSACTLFLAIRNVCITRGATLGFHAGHDRNRNITASATAHMLGEPWRVSDRRFLKAATGCSACDEVAL